MGTLILMTAFVIEVVFATYCVITKSNQEKVRSYVRIGGLAAFVLATLFSVIQWSFRWYGLAGLLLIWAALGAWALVGKKPEKREFTAGHVMIKAAAMLLLLFIAVTPALIFPQFELPRMTGTHEIATVEFSYTDASRIETFTDSGENRKVNVQFWYPKDRGGTYPLVVFSPGSFGMKGSNRSTYMDLASNGYVVCAIDHPYHSLLTIGADGRRIIADRSFIQDVIGINNGKYDEEAKFELQQGWMNIRTADINFVLDTILAHVKNTASDAVYQQIDAGKIGLMGHSLGGAASAQVARERNDIGAVIDLDADFLGEYLDYVDDRYILNGKIYPVPILTIYSDDMVRLMAAIKDPNMVIAAKHVTATAAKAYEVHIEGANHMSLTDLPLVSPFLVSLVNNAVHTGGGHEADAHAIIEKMNEIILRFFNVYLKGEGTF